MNFDDITDLMGLVVFLLAVPLALLRWRDWWREPEVEILGASIKIMALESHPATKMLATDEVTMRFTAAPEIDDSLNGHGSLGPKRVLASEMESSSL